MSPFLCFHTSPRRCRDGILRYGLIPSLPNLGQRYGIYVYAPDYYHSRVSRTRWQPRPPQDLWQVAYIGPMCSDPWVVNGLGLFERADIVSLVSQLS